MSKLLWDQTGERFYETGIDRGVLYLPNPSGVYDTGAAWNGLVSITESPSGAEANPQYANNIKYLNLRSAEEVAGTIEAFTYPDEFALCDGSATPIDGLSVGQQARKSFGLSYRYKVGNDVDLDNHAYKLALVYGATASPSERSHSTINESPEPVTFSWEFETTPVEVPNLKPSALLTIDSRTADATALAALEDILYGDSENEARLPLPAEVITLLTP